MIKYFCIMLLCLAISTQKTIKMNYFSLKHHCLSVCNDRLPSEQRLPSPASTMGLESGCDQSCCTGNRGTSESACSCLSPAGNSVAGTVCQSRLALRTKGQKSLSPACSPRPLRWQLLPCQSGWWWLWDRHCPPCWICTMDFSSSDWSGKSPAACGVPSASSCQCFPPVQRCICDVLK